MKVLKDQRENNICFIVYLTMTSDKDIYHTYSVSCGEGVRFSTLSVINHQRMT